MRYGCYDFTAPHKLLFSLIRATLTDLPAVRVLVFGFGAAFRVTDVVVRTVFNVPGSQVCGIVVHTLLR